MMGLGEGDDGDALFFGAGVGVVRAVFGLGRGGVAPEVPDQLAIVLDVEHGEALHGAEDQDLVAPEIGAEQDVAHPGPDGLPGIGAPLAEDDADPSPDGAAVAAEVGGDPTPLALIIVGEARQIEEPGGGAADAVHGMPERPQVEDRLGEARR
jgi:hypothetical protein